MPRSSGKSYKIREFQNGRNSNGEPFRNFAITIPTDIALDLPRDVKYTCEVDDEGLRFRPVIQSVERKKLPDWVKDAAENGKKPKRSRPRPKPKPAPIEA